MTPESRTFFDDATRLYRSLLGGAGWLSLRLEPACHHSQIAAIEKEHGCAVPLAITKVLKSVTSEFELSYDNPSIGTGGFEFGIAAIANAVVSWREAWSFDDDPFPFNATLSSGDIEIDHESLFPIATDISGDYLLVCSELEDGVVFASCHELETGGLTKLAASVPELLQRALRLGAPTIEGWRDFRHAELDELDLQSAAAVSRLALLDQAGP